VKILPVVLAGLVLAAPVAAGRQARVSPSTPQAGKGTIYVSSYKGSIAVREVYP
jgi:hypothetical protein